MASKKTGNLAALAALAGLAYMATRGKGEDKAKDVVKSKSMDVKPVDVKPVDVKPTKDLEVPFKGMPVKDSDALPLYLAKQSNNSTKPAITDVYSEDKSPAYKKNEFDEVYQPIPEKYQKEYQDRRNRINANVDNPGYSAGMKKGGAVKKMASGGMASPASKRADGIAQRGKTRGKMC